MGFAISRRGIHHALRAALVALFIGQGLIKVIIFTMPGTIAYFESTGSPGWLPALAVLAELFLILQIGLNMGGFYPAPAESPRADAC